MAARRRRIATEVAYRGASKRSRVAHNKALDVADAYDADPTKSLSFYTRKHGTTLRTFETYVPTRREGGRVKPVVPSKRHLYRGPIPALVQENGRPRVVIANPRTDAERRKIQNHDKAVFASVVKDDDSGLRKFSRTRVRTEAGEQLPLYTDGDELRDAADTGEIDLQDLFYSGGGRHNLDALLLKAQAP